MKWGWLVFAIIGFVLITTPVAATVYYVDESTGWDGYSAVQAQNPATPWYSLQIAYGNATDGDTVFIGSGHYLAPSISLTKSINWFGFGSKTIINRTTPSGTYTLDIGGGAWLNNVTVFVKHTEQGLRSNGNLKITNTTVYGDAPTYLMSSTTTGIVSVLNCTFYSDITATRYFYIATTNNQWTFAYNNITSTNQSQANQIFRINNPKSVIMINNTISTSSPGSLEHIYIAPSTVEASVTIRDNVFISNSTTGHVIEVGSESSSSSDDLATNSTITGNILYCSYLTQPSVLATIHPIFVGHQSDATISNNTVIGGGYGIVVKGAPSVYTHGYGGVFNNTLIDCTIGIRIKGVQGIRVENNTIDSKTAMAGESIYITNNVGASDYSINTKIGYNHMNSSYNRQIYIDSGSHYGFGAIYDRYSTFDTLPLNFTIAPDYYTLSEWQALGYDSVIANMTVTPYYGVAPFSVMLNDTSYGEVATARLWDFGNGLISTNEDNTVVYAAPGVYTVNLTISNDYSQDIQLGTVIAYATLPDSLEATFTANPLEPAVLENVTFTDISTGTPISWLWGFGDGTNSTTQNPVHAYASTGLKSVVLTVTNATATDSTTYPGYINVTASGGSDFTEVPINMTAEYTLTIHVTDSETGLPIPVVTIMDSDGQTVTTTTGTGVLTEGYGLVTGTLVSEGYYSRAFSVVVDEDMARTYQMTPVSETTTTTWWTPHTVQVNVIDMSYSNPLPDVRINATYSESSMPSQWIEDLYGIRGTTAEDMINSTLILGGTTGTDGSVTFTMLGAIKYDFYLNSATHGIANYHVAEYPSDSILNIYVSSSEFILPINRNSTYADINTTRIYVVEPDLYNVSMCIDYQDTSGRTSSVTDRWIFKNNNTEMNTTTFPPGITLNTHCYTIPNVRGTEVWWGWNATRLGV